MDPDPAIFVIDLQDACKKLIFNTIFSAYYFLKVHLHHFSKIKCQEGSQISRNQGFSYYFCMMIEGSGTGSGSGSIPLTSGSGSGRPKNMWIRIRNNAIYCIQHCFICRLSDPTVSEDAGIDPRTVATPALAVRRSNYWAISDPRLG
jgi:hypothetical protein